MAEETYDPSDRASLQESLPVDWRDQYLKDHGGSRTRVPGFADPCLSHSTTWS
jgi:hypothetical protein